jgi:hypothetical protein
MPNEKVFVISESRFNIDNTEFFTLKFFGKEVKFHFVNYDWDIIPGFPSEIKIIIKPAVIVA